MGSVTVVILIVWKYLKPSHNSSLPPNRTLLVTYFFALFHVNTKQFQSNLITCNNTSCKLLSFLVATHIYSQFYSQFYTFITRNQCNYIHYLLFFHVNTKQFQSNLITCNNTSCKLLSFLVATHTYSQFYTFITRNHCNYIKHATIQVANFYHFW